MPQIAVANDLDDVPGVRGFGGPSNSSSAHPERAGVRVRASLPERFGHPGGSHLTSRLDRESRARYRAAGEAARDLALEVERLGGVYRACWSTSARPTPSPAPPGPT